jgi:hypothetical protein
MSMMVGHHAGVVPRFTRVHGGGFNYSNCTYALPRNVSARRIRIDFSAAGTTNVGLFYVTNTIANARALIRNGTGDHILFKGNSTITAQMFGDVVNMAGLSYTYPTVFGTYDPTDVDNEAKNNTTYTTWDFRGVGSQFFNGSACFNMLFAGDFLAYSHFLSFGGLTEYGQNFLRSKFARNGLLYDRIILDGISIDDQGQQTVTSNAKPIVAITSSGTTATVQVTSTAGISASSVVVYGANEAVFNITAVLTIIDATHFSYPFAGNANAPATGAPRFCLQMVDWPASEMLNDVTLHRCGLMYGNGPNGSPYSCFTSDRLRMQETATYHGGWARGMTRATPSATVFTSAAGATSVGAQITVNSTATIAVGMQAVMVTGISTGRLYGNDIVKSVDNANQVTLSNVPVTALSGGTSVIRFDGLGPNLLKHNQYIGESCRNSFKIGCMDGYDNANQKWTGGPITFRDNFLNRCPMGFLTDPNGNIPSSSGAPGFNAYYPAGAVITNTRETTVDADDVNAANDRGWASRTYGGAVGTGHYRGVLINQSNLQRTLLQGYAGDSNNRSYSSYFKSRECIQANWVGQDVTTIANTTKTWIGNVTEAAAGVLDGGGTGSSGNFNRTALANSGINGLLSLSVWGTFRSAYSDMSGIVVVNSNTALADQIATEMNVWEYICSPAGRETFWPIRIAQHFRAPANV